MVEKTENKSDIDMSHWFFLYLEYIEDYFGLLDKLFQF